MEGNSDTVAGLIIGLTGSAIAELGIGLAEGAEAGVDASVEAESSGRIASAQTRFVAQRAQLVRKTDRNDGNRRGDMRYAKAKPLS